MAEEAQQIKRKREQKPSFSANQRHRKAKRLKYESKKRIETNYVQPHLPKLPGEVSSNWKALQSVLLKGKRASTKKDNSNHKPGRLSSMRRMHSGEQPKNTFASAGKKDNIADVVKASSDEIWFDDVDPEDIEKTVARHASQIQHENTTGNSRAREHKDLTLGGYEGLTKKIAMDCEFVGIGLEGKKHMLARVSIVNSHGRVVYDKFVAPQEKVIDYRTAISGVRPSDLRSASDFKTVQKEVSDILQGRILIGHALKNDLHVLFLDHPRKDIRDTVKYKPFHKTVKSKTPSLKKLSKQILDTAIQEREHSSVEDAQAAMRLYSMHKREWEKGIKEKKFRFGRKTSEELEGKS